MTLGKAEVAGAALLRQRPQRLAAAASMVRASASRWRISASRAANAARRFAAGCARRTGSSARPVQRAASSAWSSVSGRRAGTLDEDLLAVGFGKDEEGSVGGLGYRRKCGAVEAAHASRRTPALRPCSRAARVSSRGSTPPEAGAYSCASCAGSAATVEAPQQRQTR